MFGDPGGREKKVMNRKLITQRVSAINVHMPLYLIYVIFLGTELDLSTLIFFMAV